MITKNRYYKNTLGIFAELVIAAALDTEETTGTGGQASQATVPVTIAADPTVGDTVTITVNGVAYTHTVPGADETTQQAHDAIAAMLSANTQGFTVVSHSGTTSSVYNLAWGIGTTNNGKVISLSETGSTFTTGADVTFAGGVGADAAAADDYETFVASSNAGTMWAFWEDTKLALVAGDTKNPANINRKFFYGWKDVNGAAKCTTAIPVAGLSYTSKAYAAGQAQISKVTYGGTISNTQIIHVRIQELTPTTLPYPSWTYSAVVAGGTVDSAVTALAAAINAETEEPLVTATAATDTLTITGKSKLTPFKVTAYVEVSATAATDASAITFPTGGTQKAVAPSGDAAAIAELAEYYNIYSGGINYAPEGFKVSEFQTDSSNKAGTTQWGILMVKSAKVEDGVVRNHTAKPYVIVAVPTGSEATLAAL